MRIKSTIKCDVWCAVGNDPNDAQKDIMLQFTTIPVPVVKPKNKKSDYLMEDIIDNMITTVDDEAAVSYAGIILEPFVDTKCLDTMEAFKLWRKLDTLFNTKFKEYVLERNTDENKTTGTS